MTVTLRNRHQRTQFIQNFARDLTSETRRQSPIVEGRERYVIEFNDGTALGDLTGVQVPGLLAERLEFFSGHEDAMAVMERAFDDFSDRHEDDRFSTGPYIWVDGGSYFVLEPGEWHPANTVPSDEYLDNLSAREIKQIADLLIDFQAACRQAAIEYMRFCATHTLIDEWPDGEHAAPVTVVIDDPDAEGLAAIAAAVV